MVSRRPRRDSNETTGADAALGFAISVWSNGVRGRAHGAIADTEVELLAGHECLDGAERVALGVVRDGVAAGQGSEWAQRVQPAGSRGDTAAAPIDGTATRCCELAGDALHGSPCSVDTRGHGTDQMSRPRLQLTEEL